MAAATASKNTNLKVIRVTVLDIRRLGREHSVVSATQSRAVQQTDTRLPVRVELIAVVSIRDRPVKRCSGLGNGSALLQQNRLTIIPADTLQLRNPLSQTLRNHGSQRAADSRVAVEG
jgi:hypothetical protein